MSEQACSEAEGQEAMARDTSQVQVLFQLLHACDKLAVSFLALIMLAAFSIVDARNTRSGG